MMGDGRWLTTVDELCRPDHIDKPEFSQALCTAVQIGLVDVLRSFGVVAKTVIGHSSGEIAAAYEPRL
jgi:acyl transferase domain-containing protein